MGGILNIGVRALEANQAALQTIGNNIANVNTPGYSRQSVVLQNVQGQFAGNGYYGNGVDILTVQRTFSDFLTKQAALSQSVAASDSTRADSMTQLENLFQGGADGLGASVSDMLNSFSDIVSAPTDLTARSVVLTRVSEMASRFQSTSAQLNDLKVGTAGRLSTDITAINTIANQIAKLNGQIVQASGNGQPPNDLLDQRDQLVRDLNKYVQTTSIPATDGSVSVFLGGSQPLVLGTTASPVSLGADPMGDIAKSKLQISVGGGTPTVIDESMLGGGEVAGLLRFQNTDLIDAGNMLGRMALAIGTKMNEQQSLGLDLNGNYGTPLFTLGAIPNGLPAASNTGATALSVAVQTNPSGSTSLIASDYQFTFTSATAGVVTRVSDGTVSNFDFATTNPFKIDGLDITKSAGVAVAGDQFTVKPFSNAANTIATAFSSPKALAVANPIAASAGIANNGTLATDSLTVRAPISPLTTAAMVAATTPVTLTFTGPGNYTRSDTGATVYAYTSGVPIEYSTAPPLTGWSLTLKGVPQAGDTYTVAPNAFPQLDAGNAKAMLNLRDLAMFDGGPLTDGYASLIANIGTKVQSAKSAAAVSTSLATNTEKDRTSVSGVNLDEEAARMLQYQQAYQASGKMMQVSQNIFDTLIQSLGH
jgi:flagellar hook-associated protein 1 FlgK